MHRLHTLSPKLLSLPLLALVLGPLSGCDDPVPDGGITGQCSTENLYKGEPEYFDEVMVPEVFEVYCSFCHWTSRTTPGQRSGATPGLNYDDYESAIRWNSRLVEFGTWFRVSERTMPPMGRTPSTQELELLQEWINCALAVRETGDDDDSAGDDDDSADGDDDSAGEPSGD